MGAFLILTLPLIIVSAVVATFLFHYLWNTTMPQVFGLKAITIGQAFRLLLITTLLFSGLHWTLSLR
jgi:hypothetical protein